MNPQTTYPSPYTCAHCGKYGATWRFEVAPPDTATQMFRHWCDAACLANDGTNQPVKCGVAA